MMQTKSGGCSEYGVTGLQLDHFAQVLGDVKTMNLSIHLLGKADNLPLVLQSKTIYVKDVTFSLFFFVS